MRLIDADALLEELHHMIYGDADLKKDYEFMGIDDCIRSMPTAYDVERVVAELEDYLTGWLPIQTIYGAIDLVKRGGVE